jgi:hypothetical protein
METNLDNNHRELERMVGQLFHCAGWATGSLCYHDDPRMNPLKSVNDSTAMLIRTGPDMIVYKKNVCIQVEPKTGTRNNKIWIEALPLIHHECMHRLFGTKTLYVCKNTDRTFVFFVSCLPKIQSLTIVDKKEYPCKDVMIQWCEDRGIPVYINTRNGYGGSGDPYVTINRIDYLKCEGWNDLSASVSS